VLVFGPLQAVIIAFLLATIDLLRRAAKPGTWVLREAPDGSHFVPEETDHAPDTTESLFIALAHRSISPTPLLLRKR